MVTDVMHDETCEVFADVLGKRNAGFMQMAISTGDLAHDREHAERLADDQRTAAVVERRPGVRSEARDPSQRTCLARPVAGSVASAFMARVSQPMAASLSPSRTGTSGTTCQPGRRRRSGRYRNDWPSWPIRRAVPDLRSQVPFAVTGPIADIVVTGPRYAGDRTLARSHRRPGCRGTRQASGRCDAGHRRRGRADDGILRRAAERFTQTT